MESCDPDSNHIDILKGIEKDNALHNANLEHTMKYWDQNVLSNLLKLIAKVKIGKKHLLRELANEDSLMKIINQDKNCILEETTQHAQMRDLEKQETALKNATNNIIHQIEKLKIERQNSNMQKRLEIQRNFAKISKKLTVTNFEYKSSHISGFIINNNNFQVFDLNPSKSSEQDVTKYLWDCLIQTNTVQ